MKRNNKLVGFFCLTCLALQAQDAVAQKVIFPQEKQAGKAVLKGKHGRYVLRNDLLEAVFVHNDGKLLFGGCEAMNLMPGSELFALQLADGTTVHASDMELEDVKVVKLRGEKDAVKGSSRFDGKALVASFVHGKLHVEWKAVLRDGSHYLRSELKVRAAEDVEMKTLVPMMYTVDNVAAGCDAPIQVGNTRGAVLMSDKLFAGLETPMGVNSGGASTIEIKENVFGSWKDTWTPQEWKEMANVPSRINELGFYGKEVLAKEYPLHLESAAGTLQVEFLYQTGLHRLNMLGVDLLDSDGNTVVYDYHIGFSGGEKMANVYAMKVPYPGDFTLRYFVENKTEEIDATGNINIALSEMDTIRHATPHTTPLTGEWHRNVTLAKGSEWNVSGVVGLVAEGQPRRSFLTYSERERAVPWRPFPAYISWYELNIDRNNDRHYTTNMNENQCADVVAQWKANLFDKYGVTPDSYIWDDGWDVYGTWTFNTNFPNGFSEADSLARTMGAGIGAWLGPVGGYGTSGTYRRNYWKDKGGMQLSNPAYYQVFYDACSSMIRDYDFRFFKFDGISAQFSSVGPDDGVVGCENAEAIIRMEEEIRKIKPDVFFNTTVGTWASPFWFHVTDAVWRQESDYSEIGNNKSDRERWITYRDRLVYQNFVKNSPICPINTLMTHGFILTRFGAVSKDMNYDGILREMRCAFACGSGMVELYNDYQLMNTISDNEGNAGALWKELADCIAWQKRNEDVLPDIHWVGGNPWNGVRSEVYGWASWNGKKATLALRNGANEEQSFTTTLRKALEIPAYIQTSVVLNDAFAQDVLKGLPVGEPIDIDRELELVLPGSSVYVFDGVDLNR